MIHIVQEGDTIESISNQYKIPSSKIVMDNNLPPNIILSIGQAIMIMPPSQTYVIQDGDTLSGIAETYGVTVLQLLRNNPNLADKDTLSVGEEIVIRYNTKKNIDVFGFATLFIDKKVLRKTLPYLTYLAVFNYKIDALGTFLGINDTEIINMALDYGVAPIMSISAISETGRGSYATTHTLMNNPVAQNLLIENVLINMKLKGYVGLNMGLYSILEEDFSLYINFVTNTTLRLNSEGYEVFVTLAPHTLGYQAGINYTKSYYADLGNAANKVILITYLWQQGSMDHFSETTYSFMKELLDLATQQIPPEKIFIGMPSIAYDWELPYVEGETVGNSLSNASAITLANQLGSVIEFDDVTQTPYFYYHSSGLIHFVWFKDARSIKSFLDLIDEYGLAGVAVWNINYYLPQNWLSINSLYNIRT